MFCLYWAYDWAVRESRSGQFGLRSLFFGTFLFGLFWMLVRVIERYNAASSRAEGIASSLLISLLLVLFSAPFLLVMAESLVWGANWIVRRTFVQRWISRRRQG